MTGKPIKFEAYSEDIYNGIALPDLAAFVIHELDKLNQPLTLENIIVASFMMFPRKFSLVGYPEYPDATRVNRTLLQMRPKYRNYATGGATKGFTLTFLGEQVAKRTASILQDKSSNNERHDSDLNNRPTDLNDAKRSKVPALEVNEAKNSTLYKLFKNNDFENAKGIHLYGMLDLFSHTPKKILRKKLDQLKNTAITIGDKDFVEFIKECQIRFQYLLSD